MPQQYKKSGGNVWNNKFKTNEKQPKFTGDIYVDSDVLRDMVIYGKPFKFSSCIRPKRVFHKTSGINIVTKIRPYHI